MAPFSDHALGIRRRQASQQNARTGMGDVPAETPTSKAMAKELKRLGFRFCGPTTCYALMQAMGLVNDHLVSCPRHAEVAASGQNLALTWRPLAMTTTGGCYCGADALRSRRRPARLSYSAIAGNASTSPAVTRTPSAVFPLGKIPLDQGRAGKFCPERPGDAR